MNKTAEINVGQLYVNDCQIEMNEIDASMMFYTNRKTTKIPQIELKTTPVFLKLYSEQLSKMLKDYEKKHGKINLPKPDKSAGVV